MGDAPLISDVSGHNISAVSVRNCLVPFLVLRAVTMPTQATPPTMTNAADEGSGMGASTGVERM